MTLHDPIPPRRARALPIPARRVDYARDDRGAAIAEFALVAPLLLVVLFGIIEFGIAFNRAQAIEAAAREGARLASLSSSTTSDIDARVNDTLAGITMQGPVSTSITPGGTQPCDGNQGDPVTVRVTTQHTVTIPLLGSFPPVILQGEAVFRCEA